MKDLIIIGGGPAGLSAAIYAGRAKLDAVLFEGTFHGGQMVNTNEVENYPGLLDITGPELSMKMYEHAMRFGIQMISEEIKELILDGEIKKVVTASNTYEAKTVILAMGAKPKQLGLEGEQELWSKGISYCAICDGGFFRDKTVAVVGGGDTAVEDALYLSRMAQKVYLIHRRDELRSAKVLQDKVFQSNIEVIWDTVVTKLHSDVLLTGVDLENLKTGEKRTLDLSGLFIAVGSKPTTGLVKGLLDMDAGNYIIAGEDCKTSIPGVFAAGDIRKKELRQIITAAADGAVSVYQAEKYILENFA